MTYETTIKLKGVILNQENISQLMHNLEPFFPDLRIKIFYKDNTKISNIRVNEFTDLSFKNKQLDSVELWDSNYDNDGQSSIWLRYDSYYDMYVLKYELSNKDTYIKVSSVIDEWMTEVSDRKNYIEILHCPILELISFLVFFIPIFFLTEKYALSTSYVLISLIIAYAIGSIFRKSVEFSFPFTELDIGVNKHKSIRGVMWGLMVIIIIPAIINIIF